jgi:hypothetical protein
MLALGIRTRQDNPVNLVSKDCDHIGKTGKHRADGAIAFRAETGNSFGIRPLVIPIIGGQNGDLHFAIMLSGSGMALNEIQALLRCRR